MKNPESHIASQTKYYVEVANSDDREGLDSIRMKKVFELMSKEENGNILDMGCLDGVYSEVWLKDGWDCYGVELTDAYKKAVERGIKCVKYNLEEGIPFEDDYFDVVFAGEIIEHMMDTDYFIRECYRVLRKEGSLVLTTPNLASFLNRCLLLIGKYPYKVAYCNIGAGHIRYYTYSVLESQLQKHNFKVVKAVGDFVSIPFISRSRFLKDGLLVKLGDLCPSFSDTLIIKALAIK